MKRTPWLNYLPAILVTSCLATVAPAQAYPPAPIQTAQARAEYDRHMQMGYTATGSRDYQSALVNFRRALSLRPGDSYAANAVRNVSSYVSRLEDNSIAFLPPNWGAPGQRQGGATRGPEACTSGNKSLTALVPTTNVGTTTAEYPVLFFYVPQTSAKVEFALLDENDNSIYQKEIAPGRKPGVMSLNLSDSRGLPALDNGKKYHWYLSLVCNPENRSADIFVNGWVQRIQPEPMLASELNRATAKESVSLYAVNGIWYDTVTALARSRQSSPNDRALKQEWVELLKSVGLEEVAKEPLVECCRLGN